MAKKYRIEVEEHASLPRPWEWRVWTRKADGSFDPDFDVSGSDRTAADAFEEAMAQLDLSEAPKRTYSVCPKSQSGLHEFKRLPPKKCGLVLNDDLSDAMNVLPASDMQCALCGKLYSEHAT